GKRGTLLHCYWECKLVQPLWKTLWRALKNLKIELPYTPAIVLLGIYPKDTKMLIQRGHMHLNAYSSTINNSQRWKEPKYPSTDEWIKKMWFIYTMEYYSVMKKNEILPFTITWMELEGIILSEISQSEKDKYHMTSLMWNL
ncbi:LORF2 protein, partial [Crocuta crocuta]